MKRLRLRRRGSGQAALTPLLDTLFLLLFAVLATSEQREAEVELQRDERPAEVAVTLPSVDDGGEAQEPAEDGPLFLEIDAAGAVRAASSIDGPAESLSGAPALRAWLGTLDGVRPVEIRADAAARHGEIVTVLHSLQESGFHDVRFIATNSAREGEERP